MTIFWWKLLSLQYERAKEWRLLCQEKEKKEKYEKAEKAVDDDGDDELVLYERIKKKKK